LNIGPIPVDLEWGADRLRFAWMTQPNPDIGPVVDERAPVAAALGLGAGDLAPDLPIQRISCGVPYLIVPLRDSAAVDRAVSDAAAHRRLRPSIGMDVPIFLFALSPGADHTVYSRMFAPGLGVAEDPATGSASGPLGCYLVQHGLVSGDAAQRIVSLQGVAMQRPSRIHIAIAGSRDAITGVRVGGEAVLIARGELLV
jgi:trans-2,3-dihydro-3-hydroxyanthranilate isomerase